MKHYILGLSFFMLLGCSTQDKVTQPAQHNKDVAQKVQSCIACHGADGKNSKEGVPPLGGRSYEELVEAMQKVRDAYSPQPLLGHRLADDDIQDIASYFSSTK